VDDIYTKAWVMGLGLKDDLRGLGLTRKIPTLLLTVHSGTVADWDAILLHLNSICAGRELDLAVELCIAD
jgi:hypothetical protein